MAIDTHESNKEAIADGDTNSIEYHIIDVGNPESNFCHESGYQLQKLDHDTKERTNNNYLLHTKIRNERQPEAERNQHQNI